MKKWYKESIDRFFLEHRNELVKENKLKLPKLEERSTELKMWYESIRRGTEGYKWMYDFKEQHWLVTRNDKKIIWNTDYLTDIETLIVFYLKHKLKLVRNNKLISRSEIVNTSITFKNWYRWVENKIGLPNLKRFFSLD